MMLAYNKIAFYIGNIPVAWYALCILSGVLLAVIMAVREARKLGINPDIIYDGVLFILPAAILGARLYFVLFDHDYYIETKNQPLLVRIGEEVKNDSKN